MASASLLDEATAAAEAMAMAKRVSKLKNASRFFVAADVHPQTLDVVRTRAETFGFDVIVDDADKALEHQDVFGEGRAVTAGKERLVKFTTTAS